MKMSAITQDTYPSRVNEHAQVIPRQDPVVYGDPAEQGGGSLTAEQLSEFDRKGFLCLPRFFSEEQVEACRAQLNRLGRSERVKSRPEAIVEPDSGSLRSLFAVNEISPFFGRVASDRRILSIVSQILGSQAYVHQGRVNLKPGFVGSGFYWHSDFETWHVEDGMPRMRCVSCSILLTDNNPHNGPLMLVPGSHRRYITCVGQAPDDHYKQSLRRQKFGTPDERNLTDLVEEGGIEAPTGPAGSMLLFDCNTMHGSASNISPYPRSNLFFVYNSVENRLEDPYSGQSPRPNFIANRDPDAVLTPTDVDYQSAR